MYLFQKKHEPIFRCRAKPAASLVTTFGKIFVVLSGHILFVVLSGRFLICRPVWSLPLPNNSINIVQHKHCLAPAIFSCRTKSAAALGTTFGLLLLLLLLSVISN